MRNIVLGCLGLVALSTLLMLSACLYPPIVTRQDSETEAAEEVASRSYHIEPTPLQPASGVYHRVGRKETLWRICKTYHVSMQEVAELNGITDAAQIKVGDILFIPGAKKVLTVELPEQEVPIPPQEIKQPKGRFIWPVEGNIVGHYGVTSGMKYDGIDIAAPLGTAVKASDAGKVAFANTIPGYGNIIIIKHSDKYSTVYAHNHRNLVQEGKYVGQGAIIARLGNSHNAAASPTLHFQIRRYNKARNPLFYLR